MIAWMQTDGEPSWTFVFVFIILLPFWMWVAEQLLKGLVNRWKRRR